MTSISPPQSAQTWITQTTPCLHLAFVRVHQMAPSTVFRPTGAAGEADHVEPGSVPSSLTCNRPTLASTRRGFEHKIVPNGVQLWRRLCSQLGVPPDDDDDDEMAPPRTVVTTSCCSLLLIYRPRKDEGLSWPSWLTCSGLVYLHKWSPVSCRSSAGQRKLAGQRPTFYL